MKYVKYIKDIIMSLVIALFIVIFLRAFIGIPTTIRGVSMFPTLFPKDKLFISTWCSAWKIMPQRGDIVTFKAPSKELVESPDCSNPVAIYNGERASVLSFLFGFNQKVYVKRVVGIEGDHITISDGEIFVNGEKYTEQIYPFVQPIVSDKYAFSDVIVPLGYVFVVGDNIENSVDSRSFGCIPVEKIEGRAIFRWWPLNRIRLL